MGVCLQNCSKKMNALIFLGFLAVVGFVSVDATAPGPNSSTRYTWRRKFNLGPNNFKTIREHARTSVHDSYKHVHYHPQKAGYSRKLSLTRAKILYTWGTLTEGGTMYQYMGIKEVVGDNCYLFAIDETFDDMSGWLISKNGTTFNLQTTSEVFETTGDTPMSMEQKKAFSKNHPDIKKLCRITANWYWPVKEGVTEANGVDKDAVTFKRFILLDRR